MMKTGAEVLIDTLIDMGVTLVTGIPGHGCLPIFDALRKREAEGRIKYIQPRHETCAVHMADGYFRASGKMMAVITSIGAGAMNTMLGLATACADSTSVIVITGGAHVHMRGTGILQELERGQDDDFILAARPVTKRCWRVDQAEQIQRIVRRACQDALRPRRGPVLLSVPMDAQAAPVEVKKTAAAAQCELPPVLPAPESVEKAYDMLKNALRPAIIAGGGAYYARAARELTDLAETLGVPVVTTMASKSVFPENHPLYSWHGGSKGTECGNYTLKNADVILSLGCRFADETTSSYRKGITYNFPDTKLIQVDVDARELDKNYRADLPVQADLRAFAKALTALAKAREYTISGARKTYLREIKAQVKLWRESVEKGERVLNAPLTISRVIAEIQKTFAKDCLMVTSSGNTQAQAFQEFCFREPYSLITTGGFSTMGFSLTAAMGASLARPDKRVIVLCGDGDLLMVIQELSTLAQHRLPVTVVLCDNQAWMAIKDLQTEAYEPSRAFGTDFSAADGSLCAVDYVKIAEGFGLKAEKVSDAESFACALSRALESRAPALIEVTVDRAFPRSGGNSVGWWDVPIPADMPDKREKYLREQAEEEF